jgi:hypothetical protein
VSLSVVPASSADPGILCKHVSVGHQYGSSILPLLVSSVFHRLTHVCRAPTRGGCECQKHRRLCVDVQSWLQSSQIWVVVVPLHTHFHCFKLVTRPAHSACKHNRTPPRLEANWIRYPDRAARSQSLYRLSYPTHT